jgi:hypothetical protein
LVRLSKLQVLKPILLKNPDKILVRILQELHARSCKNFARFVPSFLRQLERLFKSLIRHCTRQLDRRYNWYLKNIASFVQDCCERFRKNLARILIRILQDSCKNLAHFTRFAIVTITHLSRFAIVQSLQDFWAGWLLIDTFNVRVSCKLHLELKSSRPISSSG